MKLSRARQPTYKTQIGLLGELPSLDHLSLQDHLHIIINLNQHHARPTLSCFLFGSERVALRDEDDGAEGRALASPVAESSSPNT